VKAGERPLLGWGGWGRSLARKSDDPLGRETVTIDSLWIIVFGKFGVVGLGSLLLGLLVPVLALWRRCPPSTWHRPSSAWPWALALVLTLYALDDLVNAMVNPVYLLIAGGLGGLALAPFPAKGRAHAGSATPARVAQWVTR
jgi:O-antigen ligase